jgi:hypothetical protein
MKIRFIETPKGRPYKAGDFVDFNGAVEETYARKFIRQGLAEEFKPSEAGPDASDGEKQIAARAAQLEERAKIEIPDDWADLKYPEMRSLAVSVSDTAIHNKEEATAAIAAELARRAV